MRIILFKEKEERPITFGYFTFFSFTENALYCPKIYEYGRISCPAKNEIECQTQGCCWDKDSKIKDSKTNLNKDNAKATARTLHTKKQGCQN